MKETCLERLLQTIAHFFIMRPSHFWYHSIAANDNREYYSSESVF